MKILTSKQMQGIDKKAIEKLSYKITPLREGLEKTIKWYNDFNEKEKN